MREKNIDLGLLVIFDAVLRECNVTRAAHRIGMSQSTVSKGIAQLRVLFGDPLFLRCGSGMVPTHKALEAAANVRQAIGLLNGLTCTDEGFDPATARQNFNVGTTDYVSYVLMPALMSRLEQIAPGVSITIHPIEPEVPEEMLLTGKVDLVLSSVTSVSHPIHRMELFKDQYVCVRRLAHPLCGAPMTVEQFASSRHLAMPRQSGARDRMLQDVLQRMGLSRDVALQVPHMLAIPATLVATDLVATVAERLAKVFAERYPLEVSPHPLSLESFSVSQLWHSRTQESLSQRWLRDTIVAIAKTL